MTMLIFAWKCIFLSGLLLFFRFIGAFEDLYRKQWSDFQPTILTIKRARLESWTIKETILGPCMKYLKYHRLRAFHVYIQSYQVKDESCHTKLWYFARNQIRNKWPHIINNNDNDFCCFITLLVCTPLNVANNNKNSNETKIKEIGV